MTKYSNGRSGLKPAASENCIFEVEPFSRVTQKSFTDVRDELRLKRALQHAIRRERAPQHLVDSIRDMIKA